MSPRSAPSPERVLVLAPTGRDAVMLSERIAASGLEAEICPDLAALLSALAAGAGAAVIAQEALTGGGTTRLLATLAGQEPWSDVPVLLLVAAHRRGPPIAAGVFERANVTLLQRPLGVQLLVSSVRSAVRARRRQHEMRRLHDELARAVQESDFFVGVVGHDLRVPLQAILLWAGTIASLPAAEAQVVAAERIRASAHRMSRMIDQLLDYTRIRRGSGIPISPAPTHLGELCGLVVQEVRSGQAELAVDVVESGDLGGTWDADRLAQVISNLVGNAAQHGRHGGAITVELDGGDPALVRLRVHSLGEISAEALPTLFEAFYQPVSTRAGSHGLGLGLFIAREIARAHGGGIAVRTGEGRTVFEVTLPRATRQGSPAQPPAPA